MAVRFLIERAEVSECLQRRQTAGMALSVRRQPLFYSSMLASRLTCFTYLLSADPNQLHQHHFGPPTLALPLAQYRTNRVRIHQCRGHFYKCIHGCVVDNVGKTDPSKSFTGLSTAFSWHHLPAELRVRGAQARPAPAVTQTIHRTTRTRAFR